MYAKCGSIEDDPRVFKTCHLEMWSLGMPLYWDMKMWARAEGTGTVLSSPT
jgi:hypothetical protein